MTIFPIPMRPGRFLAAGAGLALGAGLACLIPTPALAEEALSKLGRQVGVMDRLLDDFLVDSPNFLVSGSDAAEGFEIEDLGAIFIFRASLTGWGWESAHRNGTFNLWPFQDEKQKIYLIRGDKDGGGAKEIVIDGGRIVIKDGEVTVDENGKTRKLSEGDGAEVPDQKQLREDRMRKYEAAKEELIRFLLDYGETLRALPAGQSVRVIARMADVELPDGRVVRSLSIRAPIDDLRAYGEGNLSESAARAKISVKES